MSWATFRDRIVTALATLDSIHVVYGNDESEISGYPAAVVVASQGTDEISDNISNERTYFFRVQVYDDIQSNVEGREETENRMLGIADELDDLLDSLDLSADGAHYVKAQSLGFDYRDKEGGKVRVYTVMLEVKKIVET